MDIYYIIQSWPRNITVWVIYTLNRTDQYPSKYNQDQGWWVNNFAFIFGEFWNWEKDLLSELYYFLVSWLYVHYISLSSAFQVLFFRTYLLITEQLNAVNEITCKQCFRYHNTESTTKLAWATVFNFNSNVFLICPIGDLCTACCTLPMTIFGLSLAHVLSRQSAFWMVVENAALAINLPCVDLWSGWLDLSVGDVEPGVRKVTTQYLFSLFLFLSLSWQPTTTNYYLLPTSLKLLICFACSRKNACVKCYFLDLAKFDSVFLFEQ